jgi:glycogen synthase
MKICLISRECPPLTPYSGGIGYHYAALAPELSRQGHDVHYLTVTERESHTVDLDGVTVCLRPARRTGRAHALTETMWTVDTAFALRRLGPFDVVFAAEWGGEAAAYALRRDQGVLVTNLAPSLTQVRHLER